MIKLFRAQRIALHMPNGNKFNLFFYTAGSYYLSILYILVYICQSQSPNSSHHHHPPSPPLLSPLGVHTFVFYICVSISALQTSSSVPFF